VVLIPFRRCDESDRRFFSSVAVETVLLGLQKVEQYVKELKLSGKLNHQKHRGLKA